MYKVHVFRILLKYLDELVMRSWK